LEKKHLAKSMRKKMKKRKGYWLGKHLPEETRKKLSEIAKKRTGPKNPFYGRHHTEETIRKIKEKNSGKNSPNWGKHLSKETREKISKALKGRPRPEFRGKNNPFYGRHHTEETKRKISEANKGRKLTQEQRQNLSKKLSGNKNPMWGKHRTLEERLKMSVRSAQQQNKIAFTKGGKREDLNNIFFRSSWEANYARYLNFLKIKWQYEPKTFLFEKVKKGTLSYTPDFYLPEEDKWVEIKGQMTAKSKVKLRRFKKYYPKEFNKLIIVIRDPWGEGKSDIENMNFITNDLKIPMDRIESYIDIQDKIGGLIPAWEWTGMKKQTAEGKKKTSKRKGELKRDVIKYLKTYGYFVFNLTSPGEILNLIMAIKDGKSFFIEVENRKRGKQSQHQKKFQENIEKHGGRYLLIRSLEDLMKEIKGG